MACSKTCVVILLALILSTAGFGVTIMAWFAPPMNSFVVGARLAGPITLLVGLVMLVISCFLCAFVQDKCCECCYTFSSGKHSPYDMENIFQPNSQTSSLLLDNKKQMCDAMRRPHGQQPLVNGGVSGNLNSEKCTSSSLHSVPVKQYKQCKRSDNQDHQPFLDINSSNHPTQTSSPSHSFQTGISCPHSACMYKKPH
jgi:hypothetical protein